MEKKSSHETKPWQIDRRSFIKVASLASGGIFLLACAPVGSPASTSKPKVSANVKFAATAGGAALNALPMLVAEDMGFLKEEGITEEIAVFAGGGDVVRGLTQGGLQFGNPAPVAVAQAFEQGQQDIKLIAENAPFIMAFWVVRADSTIKSMNDIKGKKLGYTAPAAESQIFALAALKVLGLMEGQDVQLVVVRGMPEQLTALKTGVIDLAWTSDPFASKGLLSNEFRIVGSPNDFVNHWSQSMIATTSDYAKSNGDVVEAYLRAYVKAIDFMRTKTEQAAVIWAKRTDMPEDVAKVAIKNYPIQKYTAQFDPNIFKALREGLLEYKLVKEPPDWNKMVDQSYLPQQMRVSLG